jgi:predicted enzyme related to lactoylglutathione lyase
MASRIYSMCIDCHDIGGVGAFWSAVLDRPFAIDEDGDGFIRLSDDEAAPILCFFADPNDKVVKNRLHIDLAPDDRDAEVARLEGLGATQVDIGQGEQSWVVMADVEGNEFCVLSKR